MTHNHWQEPLAAILNVLDEDIQTLHADLARLTKVRDGIRALIPPGTPRPIATVTHKKPKAIVKLRRSSEAPPLHPNAALILKVIRELPDAGRTSATAKDLVDFARAAGWRCTSHANAVSIMNQNLQKLAKHQLVTRSNTRPSLWSARS